MNHIVRKLFLFYCATIALSACVNEDTWEGGRPSPAGKTEVVLHLKAPSGFSPKTRGLTVAQENNIENIAVLVFNLSDELIEVKSGSDISLVPADNPSSGTRSFSVTLTPSPANAKSRLVVIANAEELVTAVSPQPGQNYSGIMGSLKKMISGKMFTDGQQSIPMWGEPAPVNIAPGATIGTIPLHRAIARIDVGLGVPVRNEDGTYTWDNSLGLDFQLHEVYVMQPTNTYHIVPGTDKFDGTKAILPTVPAGAGKFDIDESKNLFKFSGADIVGGMSTSQCIYIPEADVRMDDAGLSGDANHTNRMAVVVGGSYRGNAVSYYRLDFHSNKNLMDVLRNHLYQFNIKSVSGNGYPTPEEAYKSLSMNMTADVIEWNDGQMDEVDFDGQYYFGIEEKKVVFSPMGDETVVLKVRTNVNDWSMWELDDDAKQDVLHATQRPSYTHSDYGYTYTIMHTGSDNYTLTIHAAKHNVSSLSDPRRERFHIKAKRLQVGFTVEQLFTNLYVSVANGDNKHLMPEGTTDENQILINILASKPVAVSADVPWLDLGSNPYLSTPEDGLYHARMNVKAAKYLRTDDSAERTGTIYITPQGEPTIQYKVSQEAPFILLSRTKEYVSRTVPAYEQVVEVYTNVLTEDLSLELDGGYTLAHHSRFAHGTLYNTDTFRPRFQKFKVTANLSTPLPTNDAFGARFVVKASAGYGVAVEAGVEYILEADIPLVAAPRITIDAEGRLVLTNDPTDPGLYFKFGSTVGLYSGNGTTVKLPAVSNGDAFDAGDVAFNPTTTAITTYSTVPYSTTSVTGLNTVAEVQAGRGDPCRLIGLTADEIKNATSDSQVNNGKWRLPRNNEHSGFTTANSVWYTNGNTFAGSVAGREFNDLPAGSNFLPAAGARGSSGSVHGQGSHAFYWSSEAVNGTNSYYLSFHSSSAGPGSAGYRNIDGFPVRCVRNTDVSAPRITLDAEGRLALTNDPTDGGLYFKFGGVVGVYSGNGKNTKLPIVSNGDEFDPGDIAFNPSVVTINVWSDIPHSTTSVTGANTLAGVKAGVGDPCRLIGLKVSDIANMTTDAEVNQSAWRLPKNSEHTIFSLANSTWYAAGNTFAGGVIGRQFKNLPAESDFLPAMGYRLDTNNTGRVANQGLIGEYRSSEVSGTGGHFLYFTANSVNPSNSTSYGAGVSVRCVPNN